MKSGAASGPGTFEIDGEQYITITTGWGSAYLLATGAIAAPEGVPASVGKVVTFKLGGDAEIADIDVPMIDRTPKTDEFGTEEQLAEGLVHYARNCTVCHGPFAASAGVLPDLRWSSYAANAESWKGVVVDGNLQLTKVRDAASVLPTLRKNSNLLATQQFQTHRIVQNLLFLQVVILHFENSCSLECQ